MSPLRIFLSLSFIFMYSKSTSIFTHPNNGLLITSTIVPGDEEITAISFAKYIASLISWVIIIVVTLCSFQASKNIF